MTKVLFKRYETKTEAEASEIIDGNFIVTKDGNTYVDYGEERAIVGGSSLNIRLTILETGWIETSETITYSSADSPSFVISTSADMTSKIGLGDRVKLTQTTVKYFIVTAITSNSITLYGGIDYTLTSAAISGFMYSHQKAPFGFPLNPDKWSVKVANINTLSQYTPVVGTWYNIGTINLSIPIGLWNLGYEIYCYTERATAGDISHNSSLSTSNSSVSDSDFNVGSEGGSLIKLANFHKSNKIVPITTKTTYYLIEKTLSAGETRIVAYGAEKPTAIKAVCAYL